MSAQAKISVKRMVLTFAFSSVVAVIVVTVIWKISWWFIEYKHADAIQLARAKGEAACAFYAAYSGSRIDIMNIISSNLGQISEVYAIAGARTLPSLPDGSMIGYAIQGMKEGGCSLDHIARANISKMDVPELARMNTCVSMLKAVAEW